MIRLFSSSPLVALAAQAAEPALDIVTEMPAGPITGISIDGSGRYVAAGSQDGTLRTWDLGKTPGQGVGAAPLRLDPGGPVLAVALSRDGGTLAAATAENVDLIDRLTRRRLHRIAASGAGLLAFSADGAHLAMATDEGVALIEVTTGQVIARTSLGGKLTGMDLHPDGRLLAAGQDGVLRLYDTHLVPVKEARVDGTPGALRLAPDGKRVAVGYRGAARVEVRSLPDLGLLHCPDVPSGQSGDLALVAWSADGGVLYASGGFRPHANYSIRRWADGGRGAGTDRDAAERPLVGLVALPRGGTLYATDGPGLFAMTDKGKQVFSRSSGRVDFVERYLGVDFYGNKVRYTRAGHQVPTIFAVRERLLSEPPPPGPKQAPGTDGPADRRFPQPVTEFEGLEVTGWKGSAAVEVNGAAVALEPGEVSQSLAIAPDRQTFLLGTERHLRLYDRGGRLLWLAAGPESPRVAVNFSGDGRLAVAAGADGTVRFHTAGSGQVLLYFVPSVDGVHFTLLSPSGYYDDDLAPDQGEAAGFWAPVAPRDLLAFFPIHQFRDVLYRPDVIDLILLTRDERLALEQADAAGGLPGREGLLKELLPPLVTLLAPAEDSVVQGGKASVRALLRSPSGAKITAIKARVQGRTTLTEGVITSIKDRPDAGGQEYTFTIDVPPGDARLVVVAETHRAASEAAIVNLRSGRALPQKAAPDKPDLYLLSVGVSAPKAPRLLFADKDARDLAAAFVAQKGKLYKNVEPRILTGKEARRDAILAQLEWLRRTVTSKDVAVVFLAGHGKSENGQYHYLTYDADPAASADTTLTGQQIRAELGRIEGRVLLFLDTCDSGGVLSAGSRRGIRELTRFTRDLASTQSGVVVYAASRDTKQALEYEALKNGVFTKAVVEGLAGKADLGGSGEVTVSTLEHYISNRVLELTQQRQTPTAARPSTLPDFPVALVPRPVYRRRWFWGTVGGTALALVGGIIGGVEPWRPRPTVLHYTTQGP